MSRLPDFDVRVSVGNATLLTLWSWNEAEFLRCTEGSAIRRIGFERWQRNIAVALGNALRVAEGRLAVDITNSLVSRLAGAGELVREHIEWALAQADPQAATARPPAPPATAAR